MSPVEIAELFSAEIIEKAIVLKEGKNGTNGKVNNF